MTLFFLCFFCIHILFLPCVGRSTFPSFIDPITEPRFRGFKTLWKPYTQLYTLLHIRRTSENIGTTSQKTTYITIDGNLRTPVFLSDYYYDDRPLGTVKKQLVLREMLVNAHTEKHEDYTQRYRLVQQKPPWGGIPPPFKTDPEPNVTTTTVVTSNTSSTNLTSSTTPMTTTKTKKPDIGAYCYVCGLNESGIQHSNCYYAFKHPERIFPRPRRLKDAKAHCIVGTKQDPKKPKRWYGKLYRGGCFKRFTDVGYVYDERGCRTKKPYMGSSFASKRFAKLEKLLYGVDNGCIFSPHAVLTPFSRPISLYVRYHVCVCKGKYCNRATGLLSVHNIYLITVMLYWLFSL